jgi:hypothetical protein
MACPVSLPRELALWDSEKFSDCSGIYPLRSMKTKSNIFSLEGIFLSTFYSSETAYLKTPWIFSLFSGI